MFICRIIVRFGFCDKIDSDFVSLALKGYQRCKRAISPLATNSHMLFQFQDVKNGICGKVLLLFITK